MSSARHDHPRLRQLRADYLRDLRRLSRIVHLPPVQLIALLAGEREQRYQLERERMEQRIVSALASSQPAVSDAQLEAWLAQYLAGRPRARARLSLTGLALRLQRAHPELAQYSPDWLRQRLARLQEAMPPATGVRRRVQSQPA